MITGEGEGPGPAPRDGIHDIGVQGRELCTNIIECPGKGGRAGEERKGEEKKRCARSFQKKSVEGFNS